MFNPDRSDFPNSYVKRVSMNLENEIFSDEFETVASRFGISATQSKYSQSDCKSYDQDERSNTSFVL